MRVKEGDCNCDQSKGLLEEREKLIGKLKRQKRELRSLNRSIKLAGLMSHEAWTKVQQVRNELANERKGVEERVARELLKVAAQAELAKVKRSWGWWRD